MPPAPLPPWIEWITQIQFVLAIRESAWATSYIESLHLLGLALLGGTILVLNLRLCGVSLRRHPAAAIASALEPWMVAALAVLTVSGVFLFLAQAMKEYGRPVFRLKLVLLLAAVLFQFTIARRVAAAPPGQTTPRQEKLVALLSVALWFGVSLLGCAVSLL